MATTYLGLGTNLGDRQANLRQAVAQLTLQVGPLVACSSFLETAPWGFQSNHPFLNAVACFQTSLSPYTLLYKTQEIEQTLGRTHKTQNGQYTDRLIDIDILLYDQLTLQDSSLTLPHPLLLQRPFVTTPLLEIAPDILHPVFQKPVKELIK